MENFFLIDQSLCDEGGHHYDYVQCVAEAASEAGFRLNLGTNRLFRKNCPAGFEVLGRMGTVHPVFRNSIYQAESDLAGLRQMKRQREVPEQLSIWHRLRKKLTLLQRTRRRKKLIQQFASDCSRLFRSIKFTPQDHIFFTTINELELMGLALYLAKNPQTINPQWHCQFHFNVFAGRPPDYGHQSATAIAVRSSFISALSKLVYHNICFYTTSNELAKQYGQLEVGHFEPLPYPVSRDFACNHSVAIPAILQSVGVGVNSNRLASSDLIETGGYRSPKGCMFHEDASEPGVDPDYWIPELDRASNSPVNEATSSKMTGPIRIVCPGAIRREKMQKNYLQDLANQLFSDYFETERVQLVVQRPKRSNLTGEKIEIKLPNSKEPSYQPIIYPPHPLTYPQYLELIHSSDIGLLFYDSHTYYSRRAGILGEFLAAGKPVVVPAGCWLAEQISEPIFRHVERQFQAKDCRRLDLQDFRWESSNVPLPGGRMSFDNHRHPFRFECDVQADDRLAAFRFDWHWPRESGVYCRIELEQYDRDGTLLTTGCQVVGHRPHANRLCERREVLAMFNLSKETCRLRFTLRNAFCGSTASIENTSVFLRPRNESGSIPYGAVGVIVPDQNQLAACVSEVVEHINHYRTTAEAFAGPWFENHNPARTLSHLVSSELPANIEAA